MNHDQIKTEVYKLIRAAEAAVWMLAGVHGTGEKKTSEQARIRTKIKVASANLANHFNIPYSAD